jgi:pyruvate decarboxylase
MSDLFSQVTVQEISTMIRNNLDPIIFIINNDGYTIERIIHGLKREYNDIQQWQYCKTLEYFGAAGNGKNKANFYIKLNIKYNIIIVLWFSFIGHIVKVSTKEEMELFIPQISDHQIQIIEVMMDKFDAPRSLLETTKITHKPHMWEEVIPTQMKNKEEKVEKNK